MLFCCRFVRLPLIFHTRNVWNACLEFVTQLPLIFTQRTKERKEKRRASSCVFPTNSFSQDTAGFFSSSSPSPMTSSTSSSSSNTESSVYRNLFCPTFVYLIAMWPLDLDHLMFYCDSKVRSAFCWHYFACFFLFWTFLVSFANLVFCVYFKCTYKFLNHFVKPFMFYFNTVNQKMLKLNDHR